MGSTQFRIPPALSSVLAALGTLQLRAVGILNRVDPLVSASNLYIYIHTLLALCTYMYMCVHVQCTCNVAKARVSCTVAHIDKSTEESTTVTSATYGL